MDIVGEKWKKMNGFSCYDVSNFGRVRSYKGLELNYGHPPEKMSQAYRMYDDSGVRRTVKVSEILSLFGK